MEPLGIEREELGPPSLLCVAFIIRNGPFAIFPAALPLAPVAAAEVFEADNELGGFGG